MSQHMKLLFGVLVAIFAGVVLSACSNGDISTSNAGTGAGDENGGSQKGNKTQQVASVTRGESRRVSPKKTYDPTDPDGLTLRADADSPLAGVVVHVPAGALSEPTTFSLASNDGTLSTVTGTPGKIIELNVGEPQSQGASSPQAARRASNESTATERVVVFERPVSITIPYERGHLAIPYHVDDDGHLHLVQVSDIDRTAHTITFDTFHASIFTWISELLGSTSESGVHYQTMFHADADGFHVVNRGSRYNRGGECWGMTTFSLWYFEHQEAAHGKFYPRFMTQVGEDFYGNPLYGQNIIATRAFTSITQQWNVYLPIVVHRESLTPQENFVIIRNAMVNTANPVVLYLAQSAGHAAHSVLATGVDGNTIDIYDVNYPGQTNEITYDEASGEFETYRGFDIIIAQGDGTLYLTEPYQNILEDAKQSFQSSGNATISKLTVNGKPVVVDQENKVTDATVTLSGHIESSRVLVERLTVFVNSTQFSTTVDLNGDFSLAISLSRGVNHLRFFTQGRDASGNYIVAPNNFGVVDLTLTADIPETAILVTLTWNTDDTDLDLYVIDPTGDFSAYYHMRTADGGVLDHDDTNGFGPEHWTLTTDDTVRYGQPYKVRVHYFSNHGNTGPTNYTVTIQTGDGADASERSYTGTLIANNPGNNEPTDTGADWANIATIILDQPGAARRVTRPAVLSRQSRVRKAPVRITVPVPSPARRRMVKQHARAASQ